MLFQNCSIFVLAGGTHTNEIFRIEVDADTQVAICRGFSEAKDKLIADKERIVFDGSKVQSTDEETDMQKLGSEQFLQGAETQPAHPRMD